MQRLESRQNAQSSQSRRGETKISPHFHADAAKPANKTNK